MILHPADVQRGATTLRALTRAADPAGHRVHGHRRRPVGLDPGLHGALARGRRRDRHRHRRRASATRSRTRSSTATSSSACSPRTASTSTRRRSASSYVDVPSLVNLGERIRRASRTRADAETLENLKHVGGVLLLDRTRRRHGRQRPVRREHVGTQWSLTGSSWSSSRLGRRAPGSPRASPCRARSPSAPIRSSACAWPSGRGRSWPATPTTSSRPCCVALATAEPYRRLGERLLREERFEEAVPALARAIELTPFDAASRFNLAVALRRAERARGGARRARRGRVGLRRRVRLPRAARPYLGGARRADARRARLRARARARARRRVRAASASRRSAR